MLYLLIVILLAGCGTEKKHMQTASELFQDAQTLFNKKSYKQAAKFYEKFELMYPANEKIMESTYKRGLACFSSRSYAAAAAVFEQFIESYPRCEYTEQATKLLFLCFYNQITRHDRDQAMLEKAIEAGERYREYNLNDLDFEKAFEHLKVMKSFNLLKRTHVALKFIPINWAQALCGANLTINENEQIPIAAEAFFRWIEFLANQKNEKTYKDAKIVFEKMKELHSQSPWFTKATNIMQSISFPTT